MEMKEIKLKTSGLNYPFLVPIGFFNFMLRNFVTNYLLARNFFFCRNDKFKNLNIFEFQIKFLLKLNPC